MNTVQTLENKALVRFYRKDLTVSDLLKNLGFEVRIRGSHHVFRKKGIIEKINLQRDGSKAKPYQVRQARNIIVKYKLGGKY